VAVETADAETVDPGKDCGNVLAVGNDVAR
jgi:hypothetical protein